MVAISLAWFATAFQAAGIASVISSLAVIVTILSLDKWRVIRTKIIVRLILATSVCDFVGSIGSSLGLQYSGTSKCYFQAITSITFYPASWLYILALTFFLYQLILTGKAAFQLWQCHVPVWCITLVCAFLPLTTNGFGNTDTELGWCYLSGSPKTAVIWYYASYADIFIVCVVVMISFVLRLWALGKLKTDGVHNSNNSNTARILSSAREAILLYPPLGLLGVWLPCIATGYSSNLYISYVGSVIAVCNGTMLGMIYFYRTPRARRLWAGYLCAWLYSSSRQGDGTGSETASNNDSDRNRAVFPRGSEKDFITIEDFASPAPSALGLGSAIFSLDGVFCDSSTGSLHSIGMSSDALGSFILRNSSFKSSQEFECGSPLQGSMSSRPTISVMASKETTTNPSI
jgi:Slime mold cyclic AMP receptor